MLLPVLLIDNLSKGIIERFVVKAGAEEVARALKANLGAGVYDSISTGRLCCKVW
jgi:hypothetical protein